MLSAFTANEYEHLNMQVNMNTKTREVVLRRTGKLKCQFNQM